jgi:endonuclease/exonuclease/phosphatase family metal-dependent hydrolase
MEPLPLDHEIGSFLAELSRFESSKELDRSALYRRLQPEIQGILDYILQENLVENAFSGRPVIRATSWNIERGIQLQSVVEVLGSHPVISKSDLFFLTELDYGMARSGNRKVAPELARALKLNYVFAPSYINLNKGSGLENRTEGPNRQGIHGNALFSRYPLSQVSSIQLPNGGDKMRGKEKRLGSPTAVSALVGHPLGPFRSACVHLDAHSTQKHRMRQMRLVLDDIEARDPDLPSLIGGDWNTSTFNSRNALFSILGYVRRVLMGVRHVIRSHYPYPDRWFERHLFRELERRGYNYRDLNEPGACTLHYNISDMAANHRMADWIPNWCFWFINWALARNEGRCSFKLDWFAGRGINPSSDFPPRVITDIRGQGHALSDHDPIVLDFALES